MRRWLALGVAAVGVAWTPFLISEWVRQPAKTRADLPAPTSSANENESQLSAATAEAAPVPKPLAAPKPEPAAPTAPQPIAAAEPSAKAEVPQPQQAPGPSEPAAESGEARTRDFRNVFDDEPRDAFWAGTEEPRLIGLLHGAGVAEAAIGDVACRKTVCRVAFRSADLEDELENKVAERMRAEFAELVLDMHDADSEQHATLYVLRSGFRLEPPSRTR